MTLYQAVVALDYATLEAFPDPYELPRVFPCRVPLDAVAVSVDLYFGPRGVIAGYNQGGYSNPQPFTPTTLPDGNTLIQDRATETYTEGSYPRACAWRKPGSTIDWNGLVGTEANRSQACILETSSDNRFAVSVSVPGLRELASSIPVTSVYGSPGNPNQFLGALRNITAIGPDGAPLPAQWDDSGLMYRIRVIAYCPAPGGDATEAWRGMTPHAAPGPKKVGFNQKAF